MFLLHQTTGLFSSFCGGPGFWPLALRTLEERRPRPEGTQGNMGWLKDTEWGHTTALPALLVAWPSALEARAWLLRWDSAAEHFHWGVGQDRPGRFRPINTFETANERGSWWCCSWGGDDDNDSLVNKCPVDHLNLILLFFSLSSLRSLANFPAI